MRDHLPPKPPDHTLETDRGTTVSCHEDQDLEFAAAIHSPRATTQAVEEMDFSNASLLAIVISDAAAAEARDGLLTVLGTSPRLTHLFDVTGLAAVRHVDSPVNPPPVPLRLVLVTNDGAPR